jgi:hypothetical protein
MKSSWVYFLMAFSYVLAVMVILTVIAYVMNWDDACVNRMFMLGTSYFFASEIFRMMDQLKK